MTNIVSMSWLVANAMLLLATFKLDTRVRVFVYINLLIFIFYVLTRYIHYELSPESVGFAFTGRYPAVNEINVTGEMIQKALSINFLGQFFFATGLCVTSYLAKAWKEVDRTHLYSKKSSGIYGLLVVFAIAFVFRSDFILGVIYDYFVPAYSIDKHNFIALVSMFFNLDMYAIYGLFYLVARSEGLNINFHAIFIYCFVFLIYRMQSGSRSGPLMVLVVLMICWGVFPPNRKLHRLKLVMLGLLCLLSASFFNQIRGANPKELNNNMTLELSVPNKPVSESKNLSPALNRIGAYFDGMVVLTNFEGDEKLKNEYLNIAYFVKSAINIMLPGTYFQCCYINTSMLPPFIFNMRDVDLLKNPSYYESHFWTLTGLSYYLGGVWAVVAIHFLGGLVLSLVYLLLINTRFGFNFLPYFLLEFVYMFFIMQGVDTYFIDAVKYFFPAVTCSILTNYTLLIEEKFLKMRQPHSDSFVNN